MTNLICKTTTAAAVVVVVVYFSSREKGVEIKKNIKENLTLSPFSVCVIFESKTLDNN